MDFLKKIRPLLFSSLTGLLLGFSWPAVGNFPWLVFIALIPLLLLEFEYRNLGIRHAAKKIFLHSYWAALLFNVITTWWIYYASPAGMVMAVVLNSVFYAFVIWLYHKTAVHLGEYKALYAFFFYWIGFEWLHYNWELSWPWLSLGNVFANNPESVQWYEYTGVLGGSLWILSVNFFIFSKLKKLLYSADKQQIKTTFYVGSFLGLAILLLVPLMFSSQLANKQINNGRAVEVVIVQPNVDPYNEKFNGLTDFEQAEKILKLAEKKLTAETQYIIAPETALPGGFNEDYILEYDEIKRLQEFCGQHNNLALLIGLSTYKVYSDFEKIPETARQNRDGDFYDFFNTAALITKDNIKLYHKSKLVLGVERLPFSWLLKPLESLAIDLGGTTGTLGVSDVPYVFQPSQSYVSALDTNKSAVGPVICYESVYGEYFSEFVKRGANFMAIITNDGWWENTPGYKQHLAYARLRAIETRRDIARSANTGISAFINKKGEILQKTEWWQEAVIKDTIYLNNSKTFYTLHGDVLGRLAAFLASVMLAYVIARKLNTTQKRLKMER